MQPKDRFQGRGPRLASSKAASLSPSERARAKRALDLGAKCEGCPFAVDGQPYRPVFGTGPHKPIGLLVAESPGSDEAKEGEPLVGPTGQQLDIELAEVGLSRDRLFKVNVVACQPPLGKTEHQMKTAMKHCRAVFINQIKHLDRDIPTIAMGKAAAVALTGVDQGVMDQRGFVNLGFKLPEE